MKNWFAILNLSKLIPQIAPDGDPLFNRRRLTYFGLAFSVYWVHLILIVYVWGPQPADPIIVTAFLGVPATLAGLGFYKYLTAAEKDDAIKSGNNINTSELASVVTVTVDNKQSGTDNQNSQTGEPKVDGSTSIGDP